MGIRKWFQSITILLLFGVNIAFSQNEILYLHPVWKKDTTNGDNVNKGGCIYLSIDTLQYEKLKKKKDYFIINEIEYPATQLFSTNSYQILKNYKVCRFSLHTTISEYEPMFLFSENNCLTSLQKERILLEKDLGKKYNILGKVILKDIVCADNYGKEFLLNDLFF